MKALTIDALWAWAILEGHKAIENRVWTRTHRGRLVIHAGKDTKREADIRAEMEEFGLTGLPTKQELDRLRGNLIGTVQVTNIVDIKNAATELKADPFCVGPYCWLLSDPQWLPTPIPCRGRQQLWEVPQALRRKLEMDWA